MLRITLPQILRGGVGCEEVSLDYLKSFSPCSVLFLSGFKVLRGGFHISKSLYKMCNNS